MAITKTAWVQPVISTNGTIGSGEFAAASAGGSDYNAYYVFDADKKNWVNKMNADASIEWYSDVSLEISSITIDSSDGYLPASGKLQYSDDNVSWTDCGSWTDTSGSLTATIVVDSSAGNHKYWKITSAGKSTAHPSNNADISNITITAQQVVDDSINLCPQTYADKVSQLSYFQGATGTETTDAAYTHTGNAFSPAATIRYDIPVCTGLNRMIVEFDCFTTTAIDSSNIRIYSLNHNIDFWGASQTNIATDGSRRVTGANSITAGAIHHFKYVIHSDVVGKIDLYVDGNLESTYTGNVLNGQPPLYIQIGEGCVKNRYFSNISITGNGIPCKSSYYEIKNMGYLELPHLLSGKKVFAVDFLISTTDTRSYSEDWNCPLLFGDSTKGYNSGDINIGVRDSKLYYHDGLGSETGGSMLRTDTVLTDGTPHRITAIADGTKVTFYHNGAAYSQTMPTSIAIADIPLYFGSGAENGIRTTMHFYEARVWNKAIDAADIGKEITGTEADLIAYYDGSTDGTKLVDKSANKNDGIVHPGYIARIKPKTWVLWQHDTAHAVSICADTHRETVEYPGINADTHRKLWRDDGMNVNLDTRRAVSNTLALAADSRRVVNNSLAKISADTHREVGCSTTIKADTRRSLERHIDNINADTCIKIPVDMSQPGSGLQNITINLTSGVLSDTFQLTTTQHFEVLDAIKGKILDYDYSYVAEEVQWQGLVQTVQGMHDVDKLLYTPFKFETPKETWWASKHCWEMAAALKKKYVHAFEDFCPSSNMNGVDASYQNIIGNLFSWTDRLPRRKVNAYILNDTMYVIQRGMEQNKIDISSTEHTVPTIDHKLIRSTWTAEGNVEAETETTDYHLHIGAMTFSGTISGSTTTCTYEDGLLTSESNPNSTTTYSYDAVWQLLRSQSTINYKDGSTVDITYEYSYMIENIPGEEKKVGDDAGKESWEVDSDMYLCASYEVDTDAKGHKSTKDTFYSYCGNGMWEQAQYQDGEFQGSSIGQGKPGSTPSRFLQEEAHDYDWEVPNTNRHRKSLYDGTFPVTGDGFLEKLCKELLAMDRNIEETVRIDVYHCDHMINFNDLVTLDGKEYHLESNEITQTPRELKQSLTLIRWFKRSDVA